MRLLAAPAVAGLAVLAAACSASGVPSEREQARDAVQALLLNCAQGQAVGAAEILTRPARNALAAGESLLEGCDVIVKLAEGASHAQLREIYREAEVVGVEVDGGLGSVAIRAPNGRESIVEVERVRGLFFVTNTPLPPPPPDEETRRTVEDLLRHGAEGDRGRVPEGGRAPSDA